MTANEIDVAAFERIASRATQQLISSQMMHGVVPAAFISGKGEGPPESYFTWNFPDRKKSFSPVGNEGVICLCFNVAINGEHLQSQILDRVCESLEPIFWDVFDDMPPCVRSWCKASQPRDLWLMFLFGLAVEGITPLVPGSQKKCWDNRGNTVNANGLEAIKNRIDERVAGPFPDTDDNWLVKIKDVLQMSIGAIEYLTELKTSTPATLATPQPDDEVGVQSELSDDDKFAAALTLLSDDEITLVKAIRESKSGLTYIELTQVSEAYRDKEIAIESTARTKIGRARKTWMEANVDLEIHQAKRSGPLVIRKKTSKA